MRDRLSNFELLRICCMLMIISGHLIYKHETIYTLNNNEEITKLLGLSFFSVAVNAFVLISGFFGLSFKKEKLIRLMFQTLIYSVSLSFISIVIGWHALVDYRNLFALFPILTKQYWFITSYIVLFVISPWLNKWIECFDRYDYKKFLLLGLMIIYVWPTISYLLNAEQFIGDSGFGIINFSYLYMLGRYIKIYYTEKYSSSQYFCGFLLSSIVLFIGQLCFSWLLGFEFTSWFSYNTIFVFVGSFCLFMTFKNMKFNSSFVNFWAKPCLAVYLIHFNPFIWEGFCKSLGVPNIHGFRYYVILICLPLLIYIICAIIEYGRLKLLSNLENKIVAVLR